MVFWVHGVSFNQPSRACMILALAELLQLHIRV